MHSELKKYYLCSRNLEIMCIMKKYLIPLLLVAFLVTAFTSCKPDEEIYDPVCKISKIWYRSDVGSPNEVYVYDEKGKELQQIIVDSIYSFDFSYNKDKTVSKIVHNGVNYTETIDLQWTDRLVDKMTYQVDGAVVLEYTFYRNSNEKDKAFGRIDSIEVTYDGVFYDPYFDDISNRNLKHPLYDKVFGDYKEIVEIFTHNESKDLRMYSVKKFTYDPGEKEKYENISQYVEVFPIAQTVITHTYQYDLNSYNPFYGLPFAYAGLDGYYLNLKTVEHIEKVVAGSLPDVEDIVYQYNGTHYMNDKGYPRQFVTISSKNNIPIHTYILYKK